MTREPFMVIGTTPVYKFDDGHFGFLAGADIDGDGSGGNLEGDPDFQPHTTYQPDLNSRAVRFFVLPRELMLAIPGRIIGCRGRVRNVTASVLVSPSFVVGDVGPDGKLGEMSIAGAQYLGIPSNPVTGGTQEPRCFYEFWPEVPAEVDATTYALQSLG